MCEFEEHCESKPLYGIDKRIGFSDKPCELNPLHCDVFRNIKHNTRVENACINLRHSQLNLTMKLVCPNRSSR